MKVAAYGLMSAFPYVVQELIWLTTTILISNADNEGTLGSFTVLAPSTSNIKVFRLPPFPARTIGAWQGLDRRTRSGTSPGSFAALVGD